jgi:hypothetical protein
MARHTVGNMKLNFYYTFVHEFIRSMQESLIDVGQVRIRPRKVSVPYRDRRGFRV